MKKLLTHIIFIFACCVIFSTVLHHVYQYVYVSTSARDKVQLAIKQKQDKVDYLFLGNSRVENNVDCELITKLTNKSCANFGISGASYQDIYVLLFILKEQGLTYNRLFLQLDSSLSDETMTKNFKASLIPYLENANFEIAQVDVGLNWNERNIPFYKYAEYDYLYGIRAIIAQVYKNEKYDISLGFKPRETVGTGNPQIINLIKLKNKYVELIRIDAQQSQAEINFFTAPYCLEMQNVTQFDQLESHYENYKNLGTMYDNTDFFSDCSHLSFEGAQRFTKDIILDYKL